MKFYITLAAALLVSTAVQAKDYPPVIVDSFMKSCAEQPEMNNYCSCVIKNIQDKMTYEEFAALGSLSQEEMLRNEGFAASVQACVQHIK